MPDLYTTLGVARTATPAEIKNAYRRLAKQLHPDRTKDDPKAADRFKTVSSAYAILEDEAKRAQYDRGEIDDEGNPRMPGGFQPGSGFGFGNRPGAGGATFEFGGADPSDLFSELFRGARARGGAEPPFRPARGADRAYALTVPFEDAARLAPQRVALANGRTLDIKLPPGVEDGTQIRLAGQGDAGPAGAGDAIVTLTVAPHPHFTRDGDDVRLTLPIRLTEGVLGARVRAPTVDGPITLTIPAGATSGRVLRLRGKGFHRKSGGRGDGLVTLEISIPADDPDLRAFVETWTADAARNPRAALGLD